MMLNSIEIWLLFAILLNTSNKHIYLIDHIRCVREMLCMLDFLLADNSFNVRYEQSSRFDAYTVPYTTFPARLLSEKKLPCLYRFLYNYFIHRCLCIIHTTSELLVPLLTILFQSHTA